MPPDYIYQSPNEPIRVFGVIPRPIFMAGFVPGAILVAFAFMFQMWLLLVFGAATVAAVEVILGWICSRDAMAIERWAHSLQLPTTLLAKANLRSISVRHQ